MLPKDLKDEIVKTLQNKEGYGYYRYKHSRANHHSRLFYHSDGQKCRPSQALVESLEESLEKKETRALRKEGVREARWVVIDYASVIVHIFNDETRDFITLKNCG